MITPDYAARKFAKDEGRSEFRHTFWNFNPDNSIREFGKDIKGRGAYILWYFKPMTMEQ